METSGRYYLHGPDHGMIRADRSTTYPPDGLLARDTLCLAIPPVVLARADEIISAHSQIRVEESSKFDLVGAHVSTRRRWPPRSSCSQS